MNRIKWLFLISWIQWVYGSEQYGNGDYASEPNKYAQFKFWRSDNIDEARPELSEWKTNYDSDQHQEQSIRPIMPKSSLFPVGNFFKRSIKSKKCLAIIYCIKK
jgi:hypothetical protein